MEGGQEPGSAVVTVQPLRPLSWTQGLILIKWQPPFSDQLLCAMSM